MAYYRAISNRNWNSFSNFDEIALTYNSATTPQCPRGIMQFQHGNYQKSDNGSLVLTPFGVDGRQLISDPCNSATAVYTRYIQQEFFQVRLSCSNKKECDKILMIYVYWKKYEVVTDRFSNTKRLNLFAFDGAPLNPMYLVYQPPQMLPTQLLNPTSASATEAKQTNSVPAKRHLENLKSVQMPLKTEVFSYTGWYTPNADWLWWFGTGITALGGVGYFVFWNIYHNCERYNIVLCYSATLLDMPGQA